MSAVASERSSDEAGSLLASLSHIERIAARRETLTLAQASAEEQLIFRLAQEYGRGALVDGDLLRFYRRMRRELPTPDLAKRWRASGLPSYQTLLGRASRLSLIPNGDYCWRGVAPLPARAPSPRPGQSVVYVLYDASNEPCYVGSTGHFRDRLAQHLRDGKPVAGWSAFPVATRSAAYAMEDRLLRQYKPYLNRRAGR